MRGNLISPLGGFIEANRNKMEFNKPIASFVNNPFAIAAKNGYSWFDILYPRGSDAEAREFKLGKYAAAAAKPRKIEPAAADEPPKLTQERTQ
jgi:hypothetical protein